MKAIRRFSVRTVLPEPIAALGELASNLRWSWHEPTRRLFSDIDPERWLKVRQDPIALLSDLTPDELARIAEIACVPLSSVSIKATTTEKLGFVGRAEGLAAQAAATVRLPEMTAELNAADETAERRA